VTGHLRGRRPGPRPRSRAARPMSWSSFPAGTTPTCGPRLRLCLDRFLWRWCRRR